MKVLLVGAGGVGEAIAVMANTRPWLEKMVLADYSLERAREVQSKLIDIEKFPVEHVDASDVNRILEIARKHQVDLLMNAVNVNFVLTLFEAAYQAGCIYMDMAMHGLGADMGKDEFAVHDKWAEKGLLAIRATGADPGMSDVFARYAQDHLFDEIEEIGVRDGATLTIEGYPFASTFSVSDTLEECTAPAIIYEAEKGIFSVEPFTEPETFNFPEGIGPLECVNVEHEEVVLIPRWIKAKRVTFKYALDKDFIGVIQTLAMLGLHSKEKIDVKGVRVAPADVVAACLPDPAELGEHMQGKTCVGTWVKGTKDGKPRQVYLYQSTDHAFCMQKYGCQAVSWQTGVNPVIVMELLAEKKWQGKGVLACEAFDAKPYLGKMADYDLPYGMLEM
ncbi:MAG: saccharopine dehydrogenase C-terminal domain-containing protein [Anaerolineales bacterium]